MSNKTHDNSNSPKIFDENSFDDLDENASPQARCLAGGVAGTMEHLGIYALDSLKTNQMTCQTTGKNWTLQLIENGWKNSFRGVSTNMGFVFVAHALQFPAIEYSTKFLERNKVVMSSFIAGAAGGVCHDLIMTPANVIKQRMQQKSSFNKFSNSWQVASSIYQTEGISQFYRSLPAQLMLTTLSIGTYYFFYNDVLRKPLSKQQENNPITSFAVRCIISSIIATTITQPFDIVVTRVNTQFSEIKSSIPSNSLKNMPKDSYLNLSNSSHLFKSSTRLGCHRNEMNQSQKNKNPAVGPINDDKKKVNSSKKFSIRNLSYSLSRLYGSDPPPTYSNKSNSNLVTIFSACKELRAACNQRGYRKVIFKENAYFTRLCISVPATFITWGVYELIKISLKNH